MAATKRAPHADGLAPQGELAELLRLEARLADRLAALELEAERIRAEAAAGRSAAEAESAARLGAELVALDARMEVARRGRIDAIGQAAEETARRLQSIDAAAIDALAAHVAAQVLGAASGEVDP